MSEHDLRIRSFRSGDNELIRKMFVKAINEPGQTAFLYVLRHPTSLSIWGAGCAVTLGGLAMFKHRPPMKYIAAATTAWSAAWVLWLQVMSAGSYWWYSQVSLRQDMASIPEHYGLEAVDDSNKDDIIYSPIGPKNFFVCEDRNGSIAGFVGLDYLQDRPKRTGEVRRMVVSPNHRRQGIAKHLLTALIAHAKKNDLQVIELGTSEIQYKARSLYEKAGWKEATRSQEELYLIDVIKYEMDLEERCVKAVQVEHQLHGAEHAIPSA